MNRSVTGVVVGILAVVVLVVGITGALIWWKIAGLKESFITDIEKKIGAQVEVTSISLNPWKGELRAAGISLVNQRPAAPWDRGEIAQATVGFHLMDIFSSTVPITIEVSSWNLTLHSRAEGTTAADSFPSADFSAAHPSSPGRIRVTQVSAEEGSLGVDLADGRKVQIQGVTLKADNNGADVWTGQIQASSMTAGTFVAGASSVQVRAEPGKITFSTLRMQCDQGQISGDGNVALDGDHQVQVTLKAVDIPATMLVSVKWQMKLSGLVSGDLIYHGDAQGGEAKGHLAVSHGKFNAFPWLGKLTLLVGLPDLTDVELDQETADLDWKDQMLHFTNVDIRKNDVIRIAGAVDVDALGQIDGKLQLGLPSTVTAKWPQLQTQVFRVQLENFNWAQVHVTGTPDHLQEDLSPRLLTAGLGQGSDLLNSATQKATDLLNNFLGK
jgi:hypothetical protein